MGINWQCFKHLFKKPFTERFPFKPIEPHERSRGRILFKSKICIGCRSCERNCPPEAITFFEKGKLTYDHAKCCYCGLCVDVCPVNAIEFLTEFDYANTNPKKMLNKVIKGKPKK
ncbi:MAG: 4Fe-4S binding protein [Nanoarchaeota archaeon]|nr:4Fe-4S binding protein [Nanoarchaeota archaeon]MCG2717472.1 4Fe-4S binding protein [Nanoarchaeota archaeon]